MSGVSIVIIIILLQDYSICVCCIGALIIRILNSLHHEVVGSYYGISSNPRIPYNTLIYIISLHYTIL